MRPMITRFNDSWFPTFSELFDNAFMVPATKTQTSAPAINVAENDKAFKIEVAAPGMTKNDFNVQIDRDDNLVILLEKKTGDCADNKCTDKYLHREFSYSKFQQTFTLPETVDKEKISAKMTDGVLTIDLPKMEPKPEVDTTRRIEIM